MRISPTRIDGAWLVAPEVFDDPRGRFYEWFRLEELQAATGRSFVVEQANQSVSRRGVIRGVHFTVSPPGQAKWVHCTAGAVLDVVVDVRVGSPTFGATIMQQLDDRSNASMFITPGLGHGFCALSESATVSYLLSDTYDPAAERGINPLDPQLGITWPLAAGEIVLSDKDAAAPMLADAARTGVLPNYADV